MPSRCLNRVTLIGNLTRDPELKYTPSGMAVVSFGLATNRMWTTRDGERKEDAQFHRVVAWNKLAELCSQLLAKGRRVFVGGRIQYREFTDQEGVRKQISEIVIDDMILLDNKRVMGEEGVMPEAVDVATAEVPVIEPDDGTIEDIVIPDEIEDKAPEKKEEVKASEKETEAEEEMPF